MSKTVNIKKLNKSELISLVEELQGRITDATNLFLALKITVNEKVMAAAIAKMKDAKKAA